MFVVVAVGQAREQGPDGLPDAADQGHVDGDPPADVLAADVDLYDLRPLRIKGPVREVSAEHQQDVAVFHRAIARRKAQQAGHADVVRVVVLDEFLAAQRVHDRRLESPSDGEEFLVRALAAGAGQDRDSAGVVEQVGRRGQVGVAGDRDRHDRPDAGHPGRGRCPVTEDLAGDHDHGDSAPCDRGTHGDLQDPRQLLGGADQLGVDAALAEQVLRVGLLEVACADLRARDVRRDGEHRQAATLATIVGEPTGGGAHPREAFRVHPHLQATIPVARAPSATSPATTGKASASSPTSRYQQPTPSTPRCTSRYPVSHWPQRSQHTEPGAPLAEAAGSATAVELSGLR